MTGPRVFSENIFFNLMHNIIAFSKSQDALTHLKILRIDPNKEMVFGYRLQSFFSFVGINILGVNPVKRMEEAICQNILAFKTLFARIFRHIRPYLPEYFRQITPYLPEYFSHIV